MIFNIIIGIWIALGLTLGFSVPKAQGLEATPIACLHVPVAAAMLVAYVSSAIYGAKWLKRRKADDDAFSLSLAEIGLWFGVIATVTGAIWSKVNWGAYWSWDPQQVGIVATLLTYAALFALRSANDDESKKRDLWAVYAIFGSIAALFWTMVYRRLVPSLHPENTIVASSRLFSFMLIFNIVGYSMLMIRIAQIRARLERVSQRMKEVSWL